MSGITNARGYPIGAMSRETGVNIETIRYYERIELLPKPGRTAGGNRQYTHDHLQRLSFIKRSRELGFSIDEIREMLKMVDQKGISCGEVHAMTMDHLSSVREKIQHLKKLEMALINMASECAKGDVPNCPIIQTLFEA
ncbi:Mercuric resistance operon regulatory protein (plasmid) [Labrenzia sp. THAF191b]|uniref:Putative transcriptional regulator n=1 Tax=Roseibium alexandrii (strain DSM 17067 / NCIMB 14079 / DFL-11) TaxID=244592 RepID=A0A5E8H818_ROSAD|nr:MULTISPECIES: helix-turn-helix domain-containing protein [Stappiaceae]EEE48187.2 putative transcriptional regulator [Roseibium alexandrii DFL-11]QFT02058.1 Mercuric resistance operon regulatory protein [Labrenzia sp. THAF191b]QFT08316.1 Mercuric resistance operon regulatory protein [Labrenzia sp. THAF191a]QFT19878.1 Mercuric resistance operon regulatory protein [Labrenzia sp. THAF187b]QFT71300.1 Mercuric resistance operon regulatory protein [Labrenzia sp. THAF35]